jgi:diaminohydroxyphosphoribosylaminopyrimidine deaminase / 5-amino-6-(5-phosphoribosylamino)uracil reductase
VVYLAPVLIGGNGLSAIEGFGAPSIKEALRLRLTEVYPVGSDLRVTATPTREGRRVRWTRPAARLVQN